MCSNVAKQVKQALQKNTSAVVTMARIMQCCNDYVLSRTELDHAEAKKATLMCKRVKARPPNTLKATGDAENQSSATRNIAWWRMPGLL